MLKIFKIRNLYILYIFHIFNARKIYLDSNLHHHLLSYAELCSCTRLNRGETLYDVNMSSSRLPISNSTFLQCKRITVGLPVFSRNALFVQPDFAIVSVSHAMIIVLDNFKVRSNAVSAYIQTLLKSRVKLCYLGSYSVD